MSRALLRAAHGRLRRHRLGRSLTQAARLRPRAGYVRDALRADGAPRQYHLRRSDLRVVLRHGTSDTTMFDEIHCAHVYAPPPAALAALDAVPGPLRVLDLGANVGLFALDARSRWPNATIRSVEPDPANLAVLERCAAANAAVGTWVLVPAAAATTPGTMEFVTGAGAESHQAVAGTGEAGVVVPTVDALELMADADLVKIDIEGGEWALLADPRLRDVPVRALVLEHHGRLCPEFPPRATAARLLEQAGFRTLAGGEEAVGVGTLWAWREPPAA